jgi:phosphatidylserine/phosphatidylglycerophosphate/cardiolipin synthase-like enzyme
MKLHAFYALLVSSLLSCASYADDIKVYFNHPVNSPAVQADLEAEIISVINAANHTLHMAVYDLDLPGIANAMAAAKARGVDVRFITDEDNIGSDNAQALGILTHAGIPWIDDTENGSAGSKIQHNKFIIVDGERVLSGSTNFTQSGIHGDLDNNGNLISAGNDNHIVIIESQQLAAVFSQQFNTMWGDGPGGAKDSLFGLGKPDHALETTYTTHDGIRVDVQFTPQSPTAYVGSTLDSIQRYIRTAKTRIDVAQFVISAQDLADEMQYRHNAGVLVRGIGDASFFTRYYSEFMDMQGTAKVNNNGVYETDTYTDAANNPWTTPADVRIANMSGGDKWHHKYFLIDDFVITGSHNASGAAAFGNDENIVVIHDEKTAREFASHFDLAFCLAGSGAGCTPNQYEEGTWEGVYFTGAEVAKMIDLVNHASQSQLDDDAALDSRAAANIVNARPINSMDQLSAIAYVGSSATQKLKNFSASW